MRIFLSAFCTAFAALGLTMAIAPKPDLVQSTGCYFFTVGAALAVVFGLLAQKE